jgi:diketogulonate reductase-like aldo/keto reductase
MKKGQTYQLYNGVEIPALGLGTWQVKNEDVQAPVLYALEAGYRHIDTAAVYGNEKGVGEAIRKSGIKREEIFVTTKLPAETKGYEETHKAFQQSLENLGLDYVDLYLIHAPWPWEDMQGDYTEGNIASWKAMEEIYKQGKAHAIGISNFQPKHITPLLEQCTIVPMVNQISFYVSHIQRETVEFCRKHDIFVEAYAPLATGAVFKIDLIHEIAKKYNVSPAQLCIAYCIQKGTAAIPKSVHKERIIQNMELDFIISDEDMQALDALDKE